MMYRIILFLLFSQIFLNAMQDTKRLLILHSYNSSYSWTNNVQNGIESIFNNIDYKIHVEYMDTKRYSKVEHFQNLVPIYKSKYKNTKFDAIIVSDNNAFSFLKFYRKEIFKNVPTIFCGINYLKPTDTEGQKDITGLSEEADVLKNFQLIKKIHPQNKDVYIVIDTTTTGNIAYNEVQKTLKIMPKDGVKYHIVRGHTLDEVEEILKDKNGVVLLTVFFKDHKGTSYEYFELIKRLDKNIKMPLYGLWDINFGNGLIGGFLTSGFFQGKEAAKMAKKVLNGENINSIDIVYKSPNKYMFDAKQLKKHNISISDLPEDRYIINYKKTFFEEYKKEINFIIIVFVLLTAVIIILFININKRKKAEKRIKESEKDLEIKVEQRTKELSKTINTLKMAQDQLVYAEKMSELGALVAGVSHEINTPIGLGLTGITHFLSTSKEIQKNYENGALSEDEFEKFLKSTNDLAEIILSNLNRAAELIRSFKQISVDQTTETKRSFNLKDYLDKILLSLKNATKNRKIEFELDCENTMVESYPGPYSQIITNLVMNTLAHAFKNNEEGKIIIKSKKVENTIILSFEDNGKGIKEENINKIFTPFFTTNRASGGTGLGLNLVYNIVKTTFDGNITCKSVFGEGTRFDIELKV